MKPPKRSRFFVKNKYKIRFRDLSEARLRLTADRDPLLVSFFLYLFSFYNSTPSQDLIDLICRFNILESENGLLFFFFQSSGFSFT